MIMISQANAADLPDVAPLFDAYRCFYHQPADAALARNFIEARLRQRDSVIFIARDAGGTAIAFAQLYPSFSSVSAGRVWVLNDLFVVPAARRTGTGRALLIAVTQFARTNGDLRIELATATDNTAAQTLYRSLGWVRESHYHHYALAL
jgi:GNAT superfamily N-acetyltransferase